MTDFRAQLEEFFYRPDEGGGEWLDVAPSEKPSVAVEEEPPGEFLAFWLEDELYAVPLLEVREVVKVPPLTEVPRGPRTLLGVMNLRGEVLPVYDVKQLLRLPSRAAGELGEAGRRAARVILIRSDEGDAGLLVDSVTGVVRLRPSMIEDPPAGVAGERECVAGLGRYQERLYILLKVQQALA